MRWKTGWVGAALIGALGGCSLLSSEAPRLTMGSFEGRTVTEEKSALAKDALFDAVSAWADRRLNPDQSRIELKDRDAGVLRIRGRAAVEYFGAEHQCAYLLTLRAADNLCRLEFETRELDNGYAPNPSHLQQMENHYQTLRAGLAPVLNPTAKP